MTRVVTLVRDISTTCEAQTALPVRDRSLRRVLRVSAERVFVERHDPIANHVLQMIEPGLEVLTCQMDALIAISVKSNKYQVNINR